MIIYPLQETHGNLDTLNFREIVRMSEIRFAASKDFPDAEAQKWEKAFASMQADGSYEKILNKYRRLKVVPIPDDARKLATDPTWFQ